MPLHLARPAGSDGVGRYEGSQRLDLLQMPEMLAPEAGFFLGYVDEQDRQMLLQNCLQGLDVWIGLDRQGVSRPYGQPDHAIQQLPPLENHEASGPEQVHRTEQILDLIEVARQRGSLLRGHAVDQLVATRQLTVSR